MKFTVGRKLKMTQIYDDNGLLVPVTVVKVGEALVTQIKNDQKDGYAAVKLGFNEGSKRSGKSVKGQAKDKLNAPLFREFRPEKTDGFSVGQKYDVHSFVPGDLVSVSGISKGQ